MFDWVKEGNVAVLQRLLQEDAAGVLERRDDEGMTALHWATDQNQVEAIKMLAEAGIEINARVRVGGAPRWRPCGWRCLCWRGPATPGTHGRRMQVLRLAARGACLFLCGPPCAARRAPLVYLVAGVNLAFDIIVPVLFHG